VNDPILLGCIPRVFLVAIPVGAPRIHGKLLKLGINTGGERCFFAAEIQVGKFPKALRVEEGPPSRTCNERIKLMNLPAVRQPRTDSERLCELESRSA